jgi:predicted MFS family arabinose efflux permease
MPSFARPGWRAMLILCLYGYQGLVAGFALTAVPNSHAALGASTAEIGAYVALVGLPWTVQPLWGPVVDRFGGFAVGRRRFWVLTGIAGAVLTLLALPWAGEGAGELRWLGLVMCAHSAFAALLDTALDAMIIDNVPTQRLGQATALTRVGFAVGTACGAAVFAWAVPHLGLPRAALLLCCAGAAALALVLLVRERPDDDLFSLRRRAAEADAALPILLRSLALAFARRDALVLVALCIAVEFAVAAFGVRLAVEMVQSGGWEAGTLSRLQGALALIGGTAGALLVGWWSDRAGPLRALLALLLLCVAAYLATAALLSGASLAAPEAASALAFSAIAPALFFVSLAPAVMVTSRGDGAATRFALFMAALNLGGVTGAAASGAIGAMLDLPQTALAAACVFALAAAVAARPHWLFGRAVS